MCSLKLLFHDGRQPHAYDPHARPPSPHSWLLETDTRLSRSLLWDMQKAFYNRQGVKAWSHGATPFYITSNPFIARSYARVALGYLRDWASSHPTPPPTQNPGAPMPTAIGVPPCPPQSGCPLGHRNPQSNDPLYIIELGAGSGRLGYLFLKQLLDMKRALPSLHSLPICYVMTDFAHSNIAFWDSHPALQPFLDQGLLDFAIFDASHQQQLTLTRSGRLLSKDTVRNPIIVLSNYLFDSLPQDAFRVQDHRLHETLLTINSDQEPTDLSDPDLLDHISIHTKHIPIPPPAQSAIPNPQSASGVPIGPPTTDYYDDPQWNRILRDYTERLNDTTILFPTGSLTCIRNLAQMSNHRMLLLSADKGLRDETDLLGQDDYYIVVHGGFSLRVNYDAIARYFQYTGGAAYDNTSSDTSFLVGGFIAGGTPDDFPETTLAFTEAIAGFGPYSFYSLLTSTQKDCLSVSLEHLLALWRLSEWDPAMLRAYSRVLLGKAQFVSPTLQNEIFLAIERCWDNYFSIGEKTDLPFDMARILHEMKRLPDALRYYQHSLDMGFHPYATLYNMGVCLYELGRPQEALACFDKLLADEPEDSMILEWRSRVTDP